MKTVNVNYQLGQLDIGLEKCLFDFYFITVSVQMDQRPKLKEENKRAFQIPFFGCLRGLWHLEVTFFFILFFFLLLIHPFAWPPVYLTLLPLLLCNHWVNNLRVKPGELWKCETFCVASLTPFSFPCLHLSPLDISTSRNFCRLLIDFASFYYGVLNTVDFGIFLCECVLHYWGGNVI